MMEASREHWEGALKERVAGHQEHRSSVASGYYESGDPWALADVALATDCIMTLLAERTERALFAVESLLNRNQLAAIGAWQMPKKLERSKKSGGRDRDRTCDPYHVKVVPGVCTRLLAFAQRCFYVDNPSFSVAGLRSHLR
jgi:hypothetical protein